MPTTTDAKAGEGKLDVVNNHEWTVGVSLLDFLRDVGKFAKVNTMLSRERYAFPPSS
jgi:tyrosyl-tRNA synthetase